MAVKELLDQAKEGFIATAPEEVQSQLFRQIKEQQESGIVFRFEGREQSPEFQADQSAWQTSEPV